MRAYILLLLCFTLWFPSAAYCADEAPDQPITISAKRLMLSEALAKLETQTSLNFRIKDPETGNRLISIWVKDQPLQDVMSAIAHAMDMRWRKIGDPLTGYRLESDKAQQEPDWQALEKEALEKFWDTIELLKLDDTALREILRGQTKASEETQMAAYGFRYILPRQAFYDFLHERKSLIQRHLRTDVKLRFSTNATDEVWKLTAGISADYDLDNGSKPGDWTFCDLAIVQFWNSLRVEMQIGGTLIDLQGRTVHSGGMTIHMATVRLPIADQPSPLPQGPIPQADSRVTAFRAKSPGELLGFPSGVYRVTATNADLPNHIPINKGDVLEHLHLRTNLNIVCDDYNWYCSSRAVDGTTVKQILESLRLHEYQQLQSEVGVRNQIVIVRTKSAAEAESNQFPESVRRPLAQALARSKINAAEVLSLTSRLTYQQQLEAAPARMALKLGLDCSLSVHGNVTALLELQRLIGRKEVRQFPASVLNDEQKKVLAAAMQKSGYQPPITTKQDSWGVFPRWGIADTNSQLPEWFSIIDISKVFYGYLVSPSNNTAIDPKEWSDPPTNHFASRSEMEKALQLAYPNLTPDQRKGLVYRHLEIGYRLSWPNEDNQVFGVGSTYPIQWQESVAIVKEQALAQD